MMPSLYQLRNLRNIFARLDCILTIQIPHDFCDFMIAEIKDALGFDFGLELEREIFESKI